MAERMFGLETEYAFALLKRQGAPDRKVALQRLFDLARLRIPNLPGLNSGGLFLGNGARFYLDCGHPELTTPEVVSPAEAVRYLLAGERLLAQLAQEVAAGDANIQQVLLGRSNVCYTSGATFGCHESYGHRADPGTLPQHVIPHLVSRVIFTGAGGFNNLNPGLQFTLSPRVWHLLQDVSGDSTSNRPIFHTKDESLGPAGYHRMHIICGESLCSQTATFLKLGTTALVVALAEGGVCPGQGVQLRAPLDAMRRFAADPDCQIEVELASGVRHTALGIQRHYLQLAERHQHAAFMPAWSGEVCLHWRDMLERLGQGPAAVSRTLDWAIKLGLYRDFAEKAGFAWQVLPALNTLVQELREALGRSEAPAKTLELALADPARVPIPVFQQLEPRLRELGLEPASLVGFLKLRRQLCELDTRFGQLDESGLFNALDRAGVLAHVAPGVDNIEAAMTQPPALGRARLRGASIQRLFGQPGARTAEWTGVWDNSERKYLDLKDPFTTKEEWKVLPPPPPPPPVPVTLPQALQMYNRGHYERAAEMLTILGRGTLDQTARSEWLRYSAWVQSRRGFGDGLTHLNALVEQQAPTLDLVTDFICCYRFHGLGPRFGPEVEAWIKQGYAKWRQAGSTTSSTAATFLGHHGHFLMRQGRYEEARGHLERATSPDFRRFTLARVLARNLTDVAELHRRLGQHDNAVRALDEAETIQRGQQFDGDLADFTLTIRAKLATDPQQIGNHLQRALALQSTTRNRVGELRTRLLQARMQPGAAPVDQHLQFALQARAQLPALAQCPLLARILERWNAWLAGETPGDVHGDQFWNV